MYTITKDCLKKIFEYTKANIPYESCGIIASAAHKPTVLTHFYPIGNSHPSPKHHYFFNAEDWVSVNYELLKRNQQITCYVHSHVSGNEWLSDEDLCSINDFHSLQAIVCLTKKDSPSMYVYRYNHDTQTFESCPLTLT